MAHEELLQQALATPHQPLHLPVLADPADFEIWRKHHVEVLGTPRADLVDTLLAVDEPLATLRASTLLTSTDPQRSKTLAETALRLGNPVVRLMGKSQLAILNILASWSNKESQHTAVAPYLLVLERILEETKALESFGGLALELELRIHSILADGYPLVEKFEDAQYHAVEAQLLAPTIGLDYVVSTSNYQLGRIEFATGDVFRAVGQFERVISDPLSTKVLANRAQLAKAVALIAIGDDNEALNCLEVHQSANADTRTEESTFYQAYTLREPLSNPSPGVPIPKQSARSANFSDVIANIMRVQETRPDQKEEIEEYLLAAQSVMQDVIRTSTGWGKETQRIWSAYISLQLGDFGIAHTRLPSLSDLENLPPFYRIFGISVLIEILERLLPTSSTELLTAVQRAAHYWAQFTSPVIEQVIAKLLLLTPTAITISGRSLKCPEQVTTAGNAAIMNFKRRAISVYNNAGVRPIQAARLTLERFEWDTDFLPDNGGTQLKSMGKALHRSYFRRHCWFRPVSPAEVCFALLSMREASTNPFEQNHFLQSGRDLKRRYGFVPSLKKVEQIAQLDQIERTLNLALANQISSIAAAQLLFGKGSRI
jgi:hypothetical protein